MAVSNIPGAAGQNAAATTNQATNQADGQTGTQNASQGLTQQQQVVMAQMFSALLTKFMSVASENANNQ